VLSFLRNVDLNDLVSNRIKKNALSGLHFVSNIAMEHNIRLMPSKK